MQYEKLMQENGYVFYETTDGRTEIYDPSGNLSGEVFKNPEDNL